MRFKKPRGLFQFRRVQVDVLTSGKLDVSHVYGLPSNFPQRPRQMCCDCCLGMFDRFWYYRQRGFCTKIPGCARTEYREGEWAFCVYCHALRNDIDLLVARASTLNGVKPWRLKWTYTAMLQALEGEAKYWEAGMPLREPNDAG